MPLDSMAQMDELESTGYLLGTWSNFSIFLSLDFLVWTAITKYHRLGGL
jgi:hypothetical protein